MKKKLKSVWNYPKIPAQVYHTLLHYSRSVHLSCINPYKWEIQDFTLFFSAKLLYRYATYSWFRSTEKGIIHQRKGERYRKCSFFNFFWRICKLGRIMMKWSDRQKYKYTEVVNVLCISYWVFQFLRYRHRNNLWHTVLGPLSFNPESPMTWSWNLQRSIIWILSFGT